MSRTTPKRAARTTGNWAVAQGVGEGVRAGAVGADAGAAELLAVEQDQREADVVRS
jgi:hypothetical protein